MLVQPVELVCPGNILSFGIWESFFTSFIQFLRADMLYNSTNCFSNSVSVCAIFNLVLAFCINAKSLSDIGHLSIPRFGRVIAAMRDSIFHFAVAQSVPATGSPSTWKPVASFQSISARS